MTGGNQRALYSREMLALAVELAGRPMDPEASLQGEARSRTCGSVVTVSAARAGDGTLKDIGIRASSCAVGQAAAALFLRAAEGADEASLRDAQQQIERWLVQDGDLPAWPDLEIIEPARFYPARHAAILLPWKAALDALSSAARSR